MNLALFDVDGTLTATNRVDNDCYAAALTEAFGLRVRSEEWHQLTHVTDSGIMAELLAGKRGAGPTAEETARFQEIFLNRLRSAHEKDPAAFAPIPGAIELLRAIEARPDWRAAAATGGFGRSARFKLRSAGFEIDRLPLASADDHFDRTEIVKTGLDRAGQAYGTTRFDRVVSVGDGSWDVAVARKLGLGFVGIGDPNRMKQLGAPVARRTMAPVDEFLELLASASAP